MTDEPAAEAPAKPPPIGVDGYTPDLGNAVAITLVEFTLATAVVKHNLLGRHVIMAWKMNNEDFAKMYETAMDMRADVQADEVIDIADDSENDWTTRTIAGREIRIIDREATERSKVRIDTRKWVAAKMKPKKYSDKNINVLEDPDGQPVSFKIVREIVREPPKDT